MWNLLNKQANTIIEDEFVKDLQFIVSKVLMRYVRLVSSLSQENDEKKAKRYKKGTILFKSRM